MIKNNSDNYVSNIAIIIIVVVLDTNLMTMIMLLYVELKQINQSIVHFYYKSII